MNLRLDRFSTNKKFNHIETTFAYRSDPRAHCYNFRGLLGKTITFHIWFFFQINRKARFEFIFKILNLNKQHML